MELADALAQLEAQAAAIAALVRSTPPGAAARRPAPDAWSTLEVVCHLCDEEREDFRARIDYTLHRPDEVPPPIDPVGWVTARDYAARDLHERLAAFLDERGRSLAWLRALRDPAWERPVNHPRLAPYGLTAGDLLAAWVAHDVLHLRQLLELRYAHLRERPEPDRLLYAGEW